LACQSLIDRLVAVNPPVIDYFLGQNEDLRDIGRLMIAWSILERESFYEATQSYPTYREFTKFVEDDWCRFLVDRLTRDCRTSKSLFENEVNFVTFNYDVSLERRIYRGLSAISLFEESHVRDFMDGNRFLHVYGKIAEDPLASPEPLPRSRLTNEWNYQNYADEGGRSVGQWQTILDKAHVAAKTIRTIPNDKGLDQPALTLARDAIAQASVVYILGFAFDANNCERLGLNESLNETRKQSPKVVCYTNFQNVKNVDRAANKLFYGTEYPHPGDLERHRNPQDDFMYEKSVGNCYEAFRADFGTPENDLLAGTKTV